MLAAKIDPELAQRVESLIAAQTANLKAADVVELVRAVLHSMDGDLSAAHLALHSELAGLVRYIKEIKSEVAALKPVQIAEEHIPTATNELDAIVEATEEATHAIMEAAEAIETVAAKLEGEVTETLADATTRIYEACSFQDITGQRIRKVVGALKAIEGKVEHLLAAFGEEGAGAPANASRAAPANPSGADPDKNLLHGPQLPQDAKKQDEIDALFKSA